MGRSTAGSQPCITARTEPGRGPRRDRREPTENPEGTVGGNGRREPEERAEGRRGLKRADGTVGTSYPGAAARTHGAGMVTALHVSCGGRTGRDGPSPSAAAHTGRQGRGAQGPGTAQGDECPTRSRGHGGPSASGEAHPPWGKPHQDTPTGLRIFPPESGLTHRRPCNPCRASECVQAGQRQYSQRELQKGETPTREEYGGVCYGLFLERTLSSHRETRFLSPMETGFLSLCGYAGSRKCWKSHPGAPLRERLACDPAAGDAAGGSSRLRGAGGNGGADAGWERG